MDGLETLEAKPNPNPTSLLVNRDFVDQSATLNITRVWSVWIGLEVGWIGLGWVGLVNQIKHFILHKLLQKYADKKVILSIYIPVSKIKSKLTKTKEGKKTQSKHILHIEGSGQA